MKQLVKKRNSSGQENVYEVTMAGMMRLRAANGPGTEDRPYEHTFRINDTLKQKGVKLVFRDEYAPRHFPSMYPGFESLLEYHIKKVVCNENPEAVASDPNLLNRAGLVEFIDDYGLEVEEELYVDDDQLRDAIQENIDDAEVFKRNQTIRRMKLGDKVTSIHDLTELNRVQVQKDTKEAVDAANAEDAVRARLNEEMEAKIAAGVEKGLAKAKEQLAAERNAAQEANLAELDKKAAAELDKKKDAKPSAKADNV